MKFDDLTPDQVRVIQALERRVVVLGGAGSGKTTVALWCAVHALERPEAKSWHRALFLTFSRTAVREIAQRSGPVTRLQDRLEIQTFHSFAFRLVQSFGRFVGFGRALPRVQSPPEIALLGRDGRHLTYDDLMPAALKIVRDQRVRGLLADRWPVVICDEFQDTDDQQWDLLCELSDRCRLVLLADPHQMIYGFLRGKGVGPHRLEMGRERADLIVDLGTPSHRDPSGVIPAMAAAIRERRFADPAVAAAIAQDRLRIHSPVDQRDLVAVIRSALIEARGSGARSIGIFGHTNQAVADLSAELTQRGVDHALVGLPEAHGEALAALEALCLHGLGRLGIEGVRQRLAVFLTSAVRGGTPLLAGMLIGRAPLPQGLQDRLDAVSANLRSASEENLEALVATALQAWPALGINPGRRPWEQASRTFGATAQQIIAAVRGAAEPFAEELTIRVGQQRSVSLLEAGVGVGHSIQLMNFHQTKGREADVVILVYRDDDWFGPESEPFPNNSKVLYVSLTRARERDIVLLPPNPHPLVAPLASLSGVRAAL